MAIRQLALDVRVAERATLANYVGEAGALLGAHLDSRVPLICVIGEAFSGKTHLLEAACRRIEAGGGRAVRVAPTAAGEITALAYHALICLDGIDALWGQRDCEEALFHLINAQRDGGGVTLIATRHAPSACPAHLHDLASRVRAAMPVFTDRLNDAQKMTLLRERAREQGYVLGDEVLGYLLQRYQRDLRSLLDVLARIERRTLEVQRRMTVPLLKEILADEATR